MVGCEAFDSRRSGWRGFADSRVAAGAHEDSVSGTRARWWPRVRAHMVSRCQVQPAQGAKYTSVWGTLAKIGREEGLVGFFKGNGTNVVRIAPYSAVQFASYERYKKVRVRAERERARNAANDLFCGGEIDGHRYSRRDGHCWATGGRCPGWHHVRYNHVPPRSRSHAS